MTSTFRWVTPRHGGRTARVEVVDEYELVKEDPVGCEDFAYEHAQQFADWAYEQGGECPAGCRLVYKVEVEA